MTAGFSPESANWAVRQPGWQAAIDTVIVALQRLGFVVGDVYVLAIPARQSGIQRSTPVSVLTLDGERFIVACDGGAAWVHDARAAGHGTLQRGRVDERVTLTEVPLAESVPVLRALPRRLPGSVPAFRRLHGIAASSEAFAGLAARCPVFRVERG